MRIQSTFSDPPPAVKSLAPTRIGADNTAARRFTLAPSTRNTTLSARHSIRYVCGVPR